MSRPGGVERAHASLLAEMDGCARIAADPAAWAARVPDTSAWSVGDHLEHLLLADRSIVRVLESAVGRSPRRADAGPGRPTLRGYLVLWTGFIPRGAGRAPDRTRPAGQPRESVHEQLVDERRRVAHMAADFPRLAAARDTFPHPALGRFTPARWLRFAAIHHAHHARIVRDILAAAGIDPAP